MTRVIGEPHHFIFLFEAQNAEYRAEQLGVDNALLLVAALNDRRLIIVAAIVARRPLAAGQQLAALFLREGHLPFDVLHLPGSGERSHLGFIKQRIADADLPGAA